MKGSISPRNLLIIQMIFILIFKLYSLMYVGGQKNTMNKHKVVDNFDIC